MTDQYLRRLKPGESVLDIGCGNGKLVSGLLAGVNYTGTDFSKTLLDEARKLYPDHDFRFEDITDPKNWENLGQYDAIFCVAVLHHIPTKKRQACVLSEIKKHLKLGGFVYLSVWNLWQGKLVQYQVGDHFEVPYNGKWKRYCIAYDVQKLSDLFTEAGFKMDEIFYADREGRRSDIKNGQNLVVIGR